MTSQTSGPVTGITNRSLRALMTGLLHRPYSMNQASYDTKVRPHPPAADGTRPAHRSLTSRHGPQPADGHLQSAHMLQSASVGDMRAARRAGRSPARAPTTSAAPMPPPQASTGTTTTHPFEWA